MNLNNACFYILVAYAICHLQVFMSQHTYTVVNIQVNELWILTNNYSHQLVVSVAVVSTEHYE